MGQDYSLPDFKNFAGGQIFIEVANNEVCFQSGAVISGTIHVNQSEPFLAHQLELRLIGEERTFVEKRHTRTISNGKTTTHHVYYTQHAGKDDVCNLIWPISPCPNQCAPAGQYSFPFSVSLPDWLPASFVLNLKKERGYASIKYFLMAQFVPVKDEDWGLPADRTFSSYRYMHNIQLIKPLTTLPVVNLQQSMEHNIGGLFGLGASKFKAEVVFEKNEFYSNDKLKLRLTCDNSECRKDVKEFKIKLMRKYVLRTNGICGFYRVRDKKAVTSHKEEYVATAKFPGCKAKSLGTADLEVDIPNFDTGNDDLHKYVPLTNEDVRLMKAFTCSVQGKLFDVQYVLKCVIKHDCWNEFGEGYAVQLPVKIMAPPMQVAPQMPPPEFQMPQNWAPTVNQQFVAAQDFQFQAMPMNDQYQQMLQVQQHDFQAFQPQFMTQDQIKEQRQTMKQFKKEDEEEIIEGATIMEGPPPEEGEPIQGQDMSGPPMGGAPYMEGQPM